MDARALRYFQAVVEFGSYSRASEYLRISQPAISRQVDRLERELGKPLFVRNSLGATPPGVGHYLLPALVERYRQSFPNTSLKILSGYSGFIHEALVRGRADLACLHG